MASATSHSLAERAFGVVDDGRGPDACLDKWVGDQASLSSALLLPAPGAGRKILPSSVMRHRQAYRAQLSVG